MLAYVVKHWRTKKAILAVHGRKEGACFNVGYRQRYCSRDWYYTEEEAVAEVERRRAEMIRRISESIEKKIQRMRIKIERKIKEISEIVVDTYQIGEDRSELDELHRSTKRGYNYESRDKR